MLSHSVCLSLPILSLALVAQTQQFNSGQLQVARAAANAFREDGLGKQVLIANGRQPGRTKRVLRLLSRQLQIERMENCASQQTDEVGIGAGIPAQRFLYVDPAVT
jgi:hypothetical protein